MFMLRHSLCVCRLDDHIHVSKPPHSAPLSDLRRICSLVSRLKSIPFLSTGNSFNFDISLGKASMCALYLLFLAGEFKVLPKLLRAASEQYQGSLQVR